MYINPRWRILTVGDGDLSFSTSLFKYHQPAKLVATVYDDEKTLVDKYGAQYIDALKQTECQVITEFDVTNPDTWQGLQQQSFDVVIFQFPLMPAFTSFAHYQAQCSDHSVNILNRGLLRTYLKHCFTFFLDNEGEQLAFITSKDVKPYSHWGLENSINRSTNIHYLGKIPFNITMFPEYQVRNVDRDKHVKPTTSYTYIYSHDEHKTLEDVGENKRPLLIKNKIYGSNYCQLCRVGPFGNQTDQQAHENTKKHQQMLAFEAEWLNYIAAEQH